MGFSVRTLMPAYQGDITIEREISGEEQKKDIRMAKELLDKLIAE